MLTTTRGRATVAGLDSSQEYALRILVLNGTTEKLLAKRQFTSKKYSKMGVISEGFHKLSQDLCRFKIMSHLMHWPSSLL